MRVFVASWFFPPNTSSEGIVTYKLFRNSAHHYDVCSSQSNMWSYNRDLAIDEPNITVFPIKTDDIGTWVDEAVRLFLERHENEPYDAIMTRSMPPESIFVAKRIREFYPDIPWIASLADPIAKSPYDIEGVVINNDNLSESEKADFQVALKYGCDAWKDHRDHWVTRLCGLKDIEDFAIKNATALIFPHDAVANYVLGTRRRKHVRTVHHTFDRALFRDEPSARADERITLSFLGHSDTNRTLEPLVRALHRMRAIDKEAVSKLRIRFIGHVTEDVRTMIYNYDLYDSITIEPPVDYFESLAIMQASDWLVHVDAYFDSIADMGGSIFFAGKIADFFATDAPIFAITGNHAPAHELVRNAGGLCFRQDDISGMAAALLDIANGIASVNINRSYRDEFDAATVAKDYDAWLDKLIANTDEVFDRTQWPSVPDLGSCKQKFLSICVPAYNVECYLDRCLLSLVSSPCADQLEVIVVDDGSTDGTASIALAYQRQYPSIVKVIRKENGGHGSTINAALELASGIYFRVIDGDDWVDSANLAKMVDKIRANGIWADLISSDYEQVYAEDGFLVRWEQIGDDEDYALIDFATSDFTREYFTMASTMMKTELLRAIGFKLQEHTFYVDVEYILFPIPFIETVAFTRERIYRYAVGNADQSINRDVFTARYEHHDRVIRRMVEYYRDHYATMPKGQRDYMSSLFVRHLLNSHYTLSVIWDADKERGYERACDFDAFLKETAPDLYDKFGRSHPAILALRATKFNPHVSIRPRTLEASNPKDAALRMAKRLRRTPLGDKLASSEALRQAAHHILG